MLEAIKILGEFEKNDAQEFVERFVDKPQLRNIKKVICIVFKKDGENLVYDHIHGEDYDESKAIKYLYRTTRHKRYNVTPTAKIKKITVGKGKEKTVDINRVVESVKKPLFLWFKTYANTDFFILSLKNVLEKKQNEIFNDFANKYNELRVYKDEKGKTIDDQANSILTIQILENGGEKYVGDIEIFKKIFISEVRDEFKSRKWGGKKVEAKGNGICCVCRKDKEVFGLALPFSFYTVDKRGFAPEFIREDAWKRLPICEECAEHLNDGKRFLDTYLQKSFYQGYRFYVIPYFVSGKINEKLIREIKRQEKNEEYEGLLIEDDYILEPIKEQGDSLTLIFMFIQPKQGGNFDIVQYVEDVSPSWLKQLDTVLTEIKNLSIFGEESLKKIGIAGKETAGDFKKILPKKETTLGGLVEAFFPNSKTSGIYSKYFIEIIGDILAQKPINKDLLFNAFMRELRDRHLRDRHVNKKDYEEKILALKSLMLLLFLNKVNLIKR